MALHMADQKSVEDVTRKLGIAQATFYRWKSKYGGLLPTEVKRLRQLEEENKKLKQLVAEDPILKKYLPVQSQWSRLEVREAREDRIAVKIASHNDNLESWSHRQARYGIRSADWPWIP